MDVFVFERVQKPALSSCKQGTGTRGFFVFTVAQAGRCDKIVGWFVARRWLVFGMVVRATEIHGRAGTTVSHIRWHVFYRRAFHFWDILFLTFYF